MALSLQTSSSSCLYSRSTASHSSLRCLSFSLSRVIHTYIHILLSYLLYCCEDFGFNWVYFCVLAAVRPRFLWVWGYNLQVCIFYPFSSFFLYFIWWVSVSLYWLWMCVSMCFLDYVQLLTGFQDLIWMLNFITRCIRVLNPGVFWIFFWE